MPNRKTGDDQSNLYPIAAVAALGLGLVTTALGYVVADPANLWLIVGGDLLAIAGILLFAFISVTQKTNTVKKKK